MMWGKKSVYSDVHFFFGGNVLNRFFFHVRPVSCSCKFAPGTLRANWNFYLLNIFVFVEQIFLHLWMLDVFLYPWRCAWSNILTGTVCPQVTTGRDVHHQTSGKMQHFFPFRFREHQHQQVWYVNTWERGTWPTPVEKIRRNCQTFTKCTMLTWTENSLLAFVKPNQKTVNAAMKNISTLMVFCGIEPFSWQQLMWIRQEDFAPRNGRWIRAGVRLKMGVWFACEWVFGLLERGPQRWSKNQILCSHHTWPCVPMPLCPNVPITLHPLTPVP